MERLAAQFLLAVIMVLPSAAQATTLVITQGYAGWDIRDHSSEIAGDGFSAFVLSAGSDVFDAFGVDFFTTGLGFGNGSGVFGRVQVGDAFCGHPDFDPEGFINCGGITLRSRGLPPLPTDWMSDEPFTASVPFAASGELFAGGRRFDVVGRGVLTAEWHPDCFDCPFLSYGFRPFAVPERADGFLPLSALVVIAGMLLVHRRQTSARPN